MTLELFFLSAMNIFFFSIVIWRIESIRDAVQDDIASIERIRELDEHDSIEPKMQLGDMFGVGSEK